MPMQFRTLTLAALTLLASAPARAQSRDFAPYMISDRNAEIALARSAAPKHISDSATVLVLTRTGYVQAAKGTNGFTCAVIRSFNGSFDDPAFWSPKGRAPHCFNPPAARAILGEMQQRAGWVLAGVSKPELEARTKRAYASHAFVLPSAGAMAYMTSHEQYLADVNPHWMPHLMFYYDKSIKPATFGAGDMTAPVINGSVGDPRSPVLTLLIPISQWSDGTPVTH
jgi:hypothetical protein